MDGPGFRGAQAGLRPSRPSRSSAPENSRLPVFQLRIKMRVLASRLRNQRHLVFGEVFEPHDAPVAAFEPVVVTIMIHLSCPTYLYHLGPATALASVLVTFYILPPCAADSRHSRGVLKRSRPEAGAEMCALDPGPEAGNRCSAGGAPGGASSPSRPVRTRTGFPRARSSDGTRNPVLSAHGYGQGGPRKPKIAHGGPRKPSGVSRRSIPSLEGRKSGTGGAHASQTTGRRSVGYAVAVGYVP